MVMSSLYGISTDQLGNVAVVRVGDVTPPPLSTNI
jgi:hypothetical protein